MDKWLKEIKALDTPFDWGSIRSIFKNEKFYLASLVNDISTEIDNVKNVSDIGHSLSISLFIGYVPEEPSWESESAIQYIKTSFLKRLETLEIINSFNIETKETEAGEGKYYVATFTISGPHSFIKKIKEYITVHLKETESMSKKRTPKKVTFSDGNVYIGSKSIFSEGMASVFRSLYDARTTIKKGEVIKKGNPIHRKVLEEAGPYKNEEAFRDAIKKIRAILVENSLDIFIKIESKESNNDVPQNHYLLSTIDLE
jgi:hypothetical protein